MASVFTRIINKEVPAYVVAETQDYIAFLDISPLKKGHTLVVPKVEVDYLFDLDDATYTGLNLFAKHVARALETAIPCNRIGVAVIGLEVPHTHIHLVPLDQVNDLDFSNPRLEYSAEELESIAQEIRAKL